LKINEISLKRRAAPTYRIGERKEPCSINDVLAVGYAGDGSEMHPICVKGGRVGMESGEWKQSRLILL